MALSNHTNTSSALPNLLQTFVEQKKALRFNNYSNPALELQEEIMASFYILIIVGFFGFLLFVMMLSNIVSSKPENYMDYLYSGELSRPRARVELPQSQVGHWGLEQPGTVGGVPAMAGVGWDEL
uniref:Uncharacterized protein n=1 Tax=Cyanoderma ruficeps TaxID=181631 RepID=A0A8C3R7S0_9PASS